MSFDLSFGRTIRSTWTEVFWV